MADPILRSKITFGSSDRVEPAKQEGKINEFDLLCLDGDTKPKMGWIDRDGNARIVETGMPEAEVTAKIEAAIEESKVYADEKVEAVVEEKVSESVDTKVSEAIDFALEAYTAEKFEITNVPVGTLVNIYENEIRIMCPTDSIWETQNVGVGGDPNCYYATFKTYFLNDDVVGYIEHLGSQVDAEILRDIKIDENGRRYQLTWLALARYDEATNTWNYYGANSTENKYIGWNYQLDQYNADNKMVATDFIRINLSNENCHFSLTPSYVNGAINDANAYTDKKIAEVANGFEIVEF